MAGLQDKAFMEAFNKAIRQHKKNMLQLQGGFCEQMATQYADLAAKKAAALQTALPTTEAKLEAHAAITAVGTRVRATEYKRYSERFRRDVERYEAEKYGTKRTPKKRPADGSDDQKPSTSSAAPPKRPARRQPKGNGKRGQRQRQRPTTGAGVSFSSVCEALAKITKNK